MVASFEHFATPFSVQEILLRGLDTFDLLLVQNSIGLGECEGQVVDRAKSDDRLFEETSLRTVAEFDILRVHAQADNILR